MSKKYVTIDGIRMSIGDVLVATPRAQSDGYAHVPGEEVRIHMLRHESMDENGILIGLSRQDKHESWSDLDGNVKRYHGIWLRKKEIMRYFTPSGGMSAVIKGKFFFRKESLEGEPCEILAALPDGKSVFVQFEKDIGGCGCDGLGKAGHCIAIPMKHVERVDKIKKSKKSS